jgi:hypothetical protein
MEEFEDPVWKALEKARPAKASPFFSRNVMRAIRLEKQPRTGVRDLLRWLVPIGCTAAVALLLGGTFWSASSASLASSDDSFYQAADLSSLVSYDDSALWAEFTH